jgi:hypothetical protein
MPQPGAIRMPRAIGSHLQDYGAFCSPAFDPRFSDRDFFNATRQSIWQFLICVICVICRSDVLIEICVICVICGSDVSGSALSV